MQPTQTNTETPSDADKYLTDETLSFAEKKVITLERELAEAKESIKRMENETICDCGEVYYCAENDNYYCGKCHCGMGNTYYELRKQSDHLRTENEALRKQVEDEKLQLELAMGGWKTERDTLRAQLSDAQKFLKETTEQREGLIQENTQLREALSHYKNNPPPHPASLPEDIREAIERFYKSHPEQRWNTVAATAIDSAITAQKKD